MNLSDHVLVAMMVTLAAFVLFVERRKSMLPKHVQPPPAGCELTHNLNVPRCPRDNDTTLPIAAYPADYTYQDTERYGAFS